MKCTIATRRFSHRTSTAASSKTRIGVLALLAIFLCAFAASASAQSWSLVPAPAGMAGIRIGTSQLWGRDGAGHVYRYESGAFKLIDPPGTPLFAGIAVGKGDSVWGLDFSDNIYTYDFASKSFVQIAGSLSQIAAGGQGVWGVSSSGHIYMFNGTSFVPPPHGEPSTDFTTVFVGSYGIGVWALDSSDNTYLYNTDTDFFDGPIGGGTKTEIGVGNAEVWSVDSSDQVFMYDVLSEEWVKPDTSASLIQVSAYSNANVWGLNSAGEVYLFDTKTKDFNLVSPQPAEPVTSAIRVGGPGVFVLSSSGNVYMYKK
ncbi:MAG: tectonin domain-containing protein [Terriglobales bacterium]|jgi:virginiamycin B lyase